MENILVALGCVALAICLTYFIVAPILWFVDGFHVYKIHLDNNLTVRVNKEKVVRLLNAIDEKDWGVYVSFTFPIKSKKVRKITRFGKVIYERVNE